jgi:hypothetical protein
MTPLAQRATIRGSAECSAAYACRVRALLPPVHVLTFKTSILNQPHSLQSAVIGDNATCTSSNACKYAAIGEDASCQAPNSCEVLYIHVNYGERPLGGEMIAQGITCTHDTTGGDHPGLCGLLGFRGLQGDRRLRVAASSYFSTNVNPHLDVLSPPTLVCDDPGVSTGARGELCSRQQLRGGSYIWKRIVRDAELLRGERDEGSCVPVFVSISES